MTDRIAIGTAGSFLNKAGKFNSYGRQNNTSLKTNLKFSKLTQKDRQRILEVAKEKIAKTGYASNKDIIKALGEEHGYNYKKKILAGLTDKSVQAKEEEGDFYDKELQKRLNRANLTKEYVNEKSGGNFAQAFLEKKKQVSDQKDVSKNRIVKAYTGGVSDKLEPGRPNSPVVSVGQLKNNDTNNKNPRIPPSNNIVMPLPID